MTDLLERFCDAMDERAGKPAPEQRWGMPEYHRAKLPESVKDLRDYDAGKLTPRQVLGADHKQVYVDSKLVARMWLYSQVMTNLRLSRVGSALTVGEKIISHRLADTAERPVIWNGPDDDDRTTFAMQIGLSRQEMRVWCPATDAAPSWMPLPSDKDSRIRIEKLTKPAPWLAGPWRLAVPAKTESGEHEKWFASKRDATAYARVWLAVLDYHDAVTGYVDPVTDQPGRFPR
jgi:hypothetical protein